MVKPSLYKSSTSSIQNAVLMLLFVIGMFVMYRYVKTIETETKLLQNHMIELSQKLQGVVSNQEDCRALLATMQEGGWMMKGGVCPMPQMVGRKGVNEAVYLGMDEGGYAEEEEDECDKDDQSVQSGEITDILRQVIGNAMDLTHQMPSEESARQMKCSLEQIDDAEDHDAVGGAADALSEATTAVTESVKVVMNIDDDGDDHQNKEENEFTEEKLLKRTNDDLKAICREMDLSIKGTKADLVARIMQL